MRLRSTVTRGGNGCALSSRIGVSRLPRTANPEWSARELRESAIDDPASKSGIIFLRARTAGKSPVQIFRLAWLEVIRVESLCRTTPSMANSRRKIFPPAMSPPSPVFSSETKDILFSAPDSLTFTFMTELLAKGRRRAWIALLCPQKPKLRFFR